MRSSVTDADGDRPLHVASRLGGTGMIRTLMLYGGLGAIDARNGVGHVALHLAGGLLLLSCRVRWSGVARHAAAGAVADGRVLSSNQRDP